MSRVAVHRAGPIFRLFYKNNCENPVWGHLSTILALSGGLNQRPQLYAPDSNAELHVFWLTWIPPGTDMASKGIVCKGFLAKSPELSPGR
jgi:hypothetical protein